MPNDLISAQETAEMISVSIGTLAMWRYKGTVDLPFYKFCKTIRYKRSDVQSFLARNRVGPEDYATGVAP